ncbi:hypothetical protein ATANTOWER_030560 [Ataeniobius toweri]|uniref:Uncharacterized protein n=1 Tax=Ataeniobius toweri TaxID=208326 RepID=A0ABU7BU60_9TELE|nr:hypothetical protein [Ataeniobius toweri]
MDLLSERLGKEVGGISPSPQRLWLAGSEPTTSCDLQLEKLSFLLLGKKLRCDLRRTMEGGKAGECSSELGPTVLLERMGLEVESKNHESEGVAFLGFHSP